MLTGLGGIPGQQQQRMFSNATVFFDLEIPALVDHRSDLVSLPRVLRRVDVPMSVMGDPRNQAAPPFRAACCLADQLGIELRELPGGRMPYVAEPEATAAAIRRALSD